MKRLITAVFCLMFIVVASTAAAREIHDELERIRHGEKPAEDEVKRQWAEITDEARSRWQTARVALSERRHRRSGKSSPPT